MGKIAVVMGNRSTFPTSLCVEAREQVLGALKRQNMEAVILNVNVDGSGTVRNYDDAKRCAALLRENADDIVGILATLPNFGDERAVADTIKLAKLDVPVLVHAFPDDTTKMSGMQRRDGFCGKISLCNNLRQYGIKYSLTESHTVDPDGEEFDRELHDFIGVCQVVDSLRGARFGQIGARPAAFNTVRYSETQYQNAGITTETFDLSEIIGRSTALADDDAAVMSWLDRIKKKTQTANVGDERLLKIAKFGVAVEELVQRQQWNGTAIQCWTSLQVNYGIMPCTIMSIMGDDLLPSACETDISGLISMYALTVATGQPSAILDWNNNVDADPNKCVLFHCSNIPTTFFEQKPTMTYNEILSKAVGEDDSYGTLDGSMAPGDITFCRVDTDPLNGRIHAYLGRGKMVKDSLTTFGGHGVVEVQNLQSLLQYICTEGFAHHVSVGHGDSVRVLHEAFSKYMGWDTHIHDNS